MARRVNCKSRWCRTGPFGVVVLRKKSARRSFRGLDFTLRPLRVDTRDEDRPESEVPRSGNAVAGPSGMPGPGFE